MTISAILNALPIVAELRRRDAFVATASATLQRWWLRDAATAWCLDRWQDHGRHFRRRINAAREIASFEFATEMDALAFYLAEQRSFRRVQPAAAQ